MFADNFLRTMDFAALLGLYPILTGKGRAAPVSNEDMARVAAAVLVAPERHAGMTYRPTGPELLSGRDMARIVAKVVQHAVVPVDLPFWMFRKVARQQRIDPIQISGFRYYVEEMKRGTFERDGGVTDIIAALTGAACRELRDHGPPIRPPCPFARQTFGNRVRAFANFNLTPFYPGYDLDRWDRQKGFPLPPRPSLSIDDERWRARHTALHATSPAVQSMQPGAAA